MAKKVMKPMKLAPCVAENHYKDGNKYNNKSTFTIIDHNKDVIKLLFTKTH